MPLDPNIITYGLRQMPGVDINAMVQQQITGMENINELERQRQADALAMKDRERKLSSENEAAAVKALLPAYAYALDNPTDLAGALELAPPQYRDTLAPYIQQLQGQPPDQIRSALMGSLSASEVGQAFLENQSRLRTYGIQERQQTVAEQRLALDKAKMEAEAKGGGKIVQWITDDAGNVRGLDAQGNIVATQPGIGKKAAATGPDGVKLKPDQRLKPDGTVELIPGSVTYNKQKSDFANDYKSAQASLQAINNLKTKVDTLAGTTGFQKMMNTGAYMTAIPNTPFASLTGAYDFQSKFDDVVSAVNTFGREIASMSGKLGNMAVQEWKNVAGSVANMDPSKMSSADLDRQLNSIATQLAIAENNVRNAYELEYGGGQFYIPLKEPAKTQGGKGTRPAGVGPDWTHMTDANGAGAWVSPDQKQIIEDQ